MKQTPLIFVMFGVIILASAILGIASYYGEADWTWISEQVAGFVLLFMVLGVALFTLGGWMRRR